MGTVKRIVNPLQSTTKAPKTTNYEYHQFASSRIWFCLIGPRNTMPTRDNLPVSNLRGYLRHGQVNAGERDVNWLGVGVEVRRPATPYSPIGETTAIGIALDAESQVEIKLTPAILVMLLEMKTREFFATSEK